MERTHYRFDDKPPLRVPIITTHIKQ